MKNGVPFDLAWLMAESGMHAEVLAYTVVFGEMEGGRFDWGRMEWEKPDDR